MNNFIQAGVVVIALMAVVYLGGNYAITGSPLPSKTVLDKTITIKPAVETKKQAEVIKTPVRQIAKILALKPKQDVIIPTTEPVKEILPTHVEATTVTSAEASFTAEPAPAEIVEIDYIKAGKKVFKKCKACHTIEQGGKNKIGPNLWAIVNKNIATTEGFKYSEAFLYLTRGTFSPSARGTFKWDEESLDKYLTKPKDFLPGNKMAFAGIRKPEDRKALIEYLKGMQ